jgi:hypothetical protein
MVTIIALGFAAIAVLVAVGFICRSLLRTAMGVVKALSADHLPDFIFRSNEERGKEENEH